MQLLTQSRKSPGGTRTGTLRRLGRACHESKITPAPSPSLGPEGGIRVRRHHVNRPQVAPFLDQSISRGAYRGPEGKRLPQGHRAPWLDSSVRSVADTWPRGPRIGWETLYPAPQGPLHQNRAPGTRSYYALCQAAFLPARGRFPHPGRHPDPNPKPEHRGVRAKRRSL